MVSNSIRLAVVALMFVASTSWGQGVPANTQPTATQTTTTQSAARQTMPMTSEEKTLVERTVLSDERVRRVVGAEKPQVLVSEAHVDKAEAEAFLAGATDKPPTHLVTVVAFNTKTNRAVQTLMSLEQRRILEVQEIKATEVPLSREDADEALVLAKASPDVRRIVGNRLDQFVILEPGNDARVALAAQVLPVASTNPNDPCSVDRCLELIFRTETGYLPVRAGVDLTRHTVKLAGGEQHKGERQ
jgi:hypothetical protein